MSNIYDDEINLLIQACIADLRRLAIDVPDDLDNHPDIQHAIIMYVKGHFGNTDITNKESFIKAYKALRSNLVLSDNCKDVLHR